jgi:hypothetical protein
MRKCGVVRVFFYQKRVASMLKEIIKVYQTTDSRTGSTHEWRFIVNVQDRGTHLAAYAHIDANGVIVDLYLPEGQTLPKFVDVPKESAREATLTSAEALARLSEADMRLIRLQIRLEVISALRKRLNELTEHTYYTQAKLKEYEELGAKEHEEFGDEIVATTRCCL